MAYSVSLSPPSDRGKQLNLWSKPGFMEAVAELQGLNPQHLCCYKGQELVALLPVYEKKILGSSSLVSPVGSYYQGINLWLGENSLPARKLLDTLQIFDTVGKFCKAKYRKVRINLTPETYDIRGFVFSGLKAKPLYTFTAVPGVELQPLPDERQKIRLARSRGYIASCNYSHQDFIVLFRAMNSKKNREFKSGYAAFSRFLDALSVLGIMEQFNLLHDGEIVSSNILLLDANKAYTIFRATEPEALKNGASGLHSILLLEYLHGKGVSELDFCGANVLEVARFKAALGLNLKAFFHIYG